MDSSETLRPSPLGDHVRDILDSLPDGVYTVDPEWRITSFNKAAERLTGIREEDAVGRFCYKVLRTDECIRDCPLAGTLESGTSVFNFEIRAAPEEGRRLNLLMNTAVLRDADGHPLGGVVSFRDITLDKRLRERVLGKSDFQGMVGRSRQMREIYGLIQELSDCCSTALISGESGTGKELVARAIQRLSPRREKPFIKVNCAVFSESLLESELFGHVRGAFTDARQDRPGRFELADGGTLFLDEIGEASPAVQSKLLRVLQEQEFERVGGSETIRVNVRVIAATNRPLLEQIAEGRFREDLYYRLNVIPIAIPPLRERPEDVVPLVEHFLRRTRAVTDRPIRGFSPRAMARMLEYSWPGNIRELENAVEHAFVRCHGSLIQETHLPETLRREPEAPTAPLDSAHPAGLDEETRLLEALRAARWNRQRAAELLGISRTTLWRRMVSHGLLEETGA